MKVYLQQLLAAQILQNLTGILRDGCDYIDWDGSTAYTRLNATLPPQSNTTVRAYLRRCALAFQQFNTTPGAAHLVDYGGDKRFFLEMVPTYIHALPSLQFGNAFLLEVSARRVLLLLLSAFPSTAAS